MWPFNKKKDFDFGSFEKELGAGGLGEHDEDSANLFPTTHEERMQMAQSISNTTDNIRTPSSPAPVMNLHEPATPDAYGQGFAPSSHYTSQTEQNSSSPSSNLDHKIEMLTKQIEILTSRIELLKAHTESMQNKLSVIEQALEKKPKDSMW